MEVGLFYEKLVLSPVTLWGALPPEQPLKNIFEELGLQKRSGKKVIYERQSSAKKIKKEGSSAWSNGEKRSRFADSSIKKLWFNEEMRLLAEGNLQEILITEDGNLWAYMDGITKVDNEEFLARSLGKKSRAGGS